MGSDHRKNAAPAAVRLTVSKIERHDAVVFFDEPMRLIGAEDLVVGVVTGDGRLRRCAIATYGWRNLKSARKAAPSGDRRTVSMSIRSISGHGARTVIAVSPDIQCFM